MRHTIFLKRPVVPWRILECYQKIPGFSGLKDSMPHRLQLKLYNTRKILYNYWQMSHGQLSIDVPQCLKRLTKDGKLQSSENFWSLKININISKWIFHRKNPRIPSSLTINFSKEKLAVTFFTDDTVIDDTVRYYEKTLIYY